VVIVDDGIATGSTARAACQVARARGAARVVLAVPVAPRDWTRRLAGCADELVSVATPEPFAAVGQFYADFSQTSDDEVVSCLRRAAAAIATPARGPVDPVDPPVADTPIRDEDVCITVGSVVLHGHLTVPASIRGMIVFVHGSGSSRHSPRNRFVAGVLNAAGFATLLFDLLSVDEERDRANVFDIRMLAARLVEVTRWVRRQPEVQGTSLGYFGASTGAAAALAAAAVPDTAVAAVVSRGGRPDLAGPLLAAVTAPTLLIVGERDHATLDLNHQAQARLRCESCLAVVPGATHLFEEPGTVAIAANLALDWFTGRLTGADALQSTT
jgi:putative phosphoribosyl transferase